MAKVKKKRNKKYTGADAADARPKVTRVQAVSRNPLNQWLHERKKLARPIGIGAIVIGILALIISGILSLF